MSGDLCLDGLTRNVKVSQLLLGEKKKRKRGRECSDDGEGKAWTTVRPDLLKEWNRE